MREVATTTTLQSNIAHSHFGEANSNDQCSNGELLMDWHVCSQEREM